MMDTTSHSFMGDVFQQAANLPFADLHFCNDPASQLQSIIAIHSTELGPALGGTRFIPYPDTDRAVNDALRLAKGMTYKAAINHLCYGGGKAVILYPDQLKNRHALLGAYGDFVESLGGRYITAVDSGTSPRDMDIIASRTDHVVCTTQQMAGTGDPSPYTARGVLYGIQAALKAHCGSDQINAKHIAVQGAGHVGYALIKMLHEQGAVISVCDTSESALKACVDEFGCNVVSVDDIYDVECDVFSPCALGQSITEETLPRLKASIIAGSSNNQLSNEKLGEQISKAGILYAPDYVINSGGLLQIGYIDQAEMINEKIERIYNTLLTIFEKAEQQKKPTHYIADRQAEAVIRKHIADSASRA